MVASLQGSEPGSNILPFHASFKTIAIKYTKLQYFDFCFEFHCKVRAETEENVWIKEETGG
jgi:hypothetical protein